MARSSAKRRTKSKTSAKAKAKTLARRGTRKAGAVIGTGGYGCVFSPPLPCKGKARPDNDYVSKLMYEDTAEDEMKEINNAKRILSQIPDASKYFSVMDVEQCELGAMTESDIKGKHCFPIDLYHVKNQMRDVGHDKTVSILQQKNFGVPFDQYVMNDVKSAEQMGELFYNMQELLLKGIIPMNELGVYHEDLKADNILVQNDQPTIIDWGLTMINEGGPVTKCDFKDKPLIWDEDGPKPAMTSLRMFNAPWVGPMFFQAAFQGDEVGAMNSALENENEDMMIRQVLEQFEYEGHFNYLRNKILKPALEILRIVGETKYGTKRVSSQVIFTEYLRMNYRAFRDESAETGVDLDMLVKTVQSNIDLWGWAMTVCVLVSKPEPSWMESSQISNYYLGLARMIFYLFTDGAVKIDPKKLVQFLNDAFPAQQSAKSAMGKPTSVTLMRRTQLSPNRIRGTPALNAKIKTIVEDTEDMPSPSDPKPLSPIEESPIRSRLRSAKGGKKNGNRTHKHKRHHGRKAYGKASRKMHHRK
jgi:serine/threonine protein kinase